MSDGRYHVGMVCLNGHPINDAADEYPEINASYCGQCGESTIVQCPQCGQNIRGDYDVPGVAVMGFPWKPPKFCHACGKPYPWTERAREAISEAISEIQDLTPEDAVKLRDSIPDVLKNTPKTDVAAGRFKKAIALGKAGGKILQDILVKVGTEVVVKSITGP